jgi:hypothetical protein
LWYVTPRWGRERFVQEENMPKKLVRLTVRDGKVVAYDDNTRQWFLVRFEPLELGALEKDELIEAVEHVLGCSGRGHVVC